MTEQDIFDYVCRSILNGARKNPLRCLIPDEDYTPEMEHSPSALSVIEDKEEGEDISEFHARFQAYRNSDVGRAIEKTIGREIEFEDLQLLAMLSMVLSDRLTTASVHRCLSYLASENGLSSSVLQSSSIN